MEFLECAHELGGAHEANDPSLKKTSTLRMIPQRLSGPLVAGSSQIQSTTSSIQNSRKAASGMQVGTHSFIALPHRLNSIFVLIILCSPSRRTLWVESLGKILTFNFY